MFLKLLYTVLAIGCLGVLATVNAPVLNAQVLDAGSAQVRDLPDAQAEGLTIILKNARFGVQSAGLVQADLSGLDLHAGSVKGVGFTLRQANLNNQLILDDAKLTTGPCQLDPVALLNNHRLVFAPAVNAAVTVGISQAHLQQYIAHPKTLERITGGLAKATGGLLQMRLLNPRVKFLPGNKMLLDATLNMGGALESPLQMEGTLGIRDGIIGLSGTSLTANSGAIPENFALMIENSLNRSIKKVQQENALANLVAQKVTLSKSGGLLITGTAMVSDLTFGKTK